MALVVKKPPASVGNMRPRFDPWVRKMPWRRRWQPTPVFMPGESHGQRGLADYRPRGRTVGHDRSSLAHTHMLITVSIFVVCLLLLLFFLVIHNGMLVLVSWY